MTKRIYKKLRPQDARRDLRTLWSSVAVYSCADGTLRLEPTWRKQFDKPGMLTRMHVAACVFDVLSLPAKRINWEKRLNASAK